MLALGPDNGSKRPSGGPFFFNEKKGSHTSAADQPENYEWRFLTSRCVSCWKLASTSAIRPTAGTRRWVNTSSAPATTFTSSISPRPCRCCIAALQAVSRHRRQGRPHPVRRHQAPGGRRHRRGGQAVGAVLRQFALARRHADQLEDHLRFDLAPAQARGDARHRRGAELHQERAPDDAARARQARPLARRHQGHGRRARPASS